MNKSAVEYITVEQYKDLDDHAKRRYHPEYKKYRTRKEREYSECDCCDHRKFLGWVEVSVGVGDPYRYYRSANLVDILMWGIAASTVDKANDANVLHDRLMKSEENKRWQ